MKILGIVLFPAIVVLIVLYLFILMSRTYHSDTEVALVLAACFCVMALFFMMLYPVVF